MIKTMGLVARKKSLTPEQFFEHWTKIHGPMVKSVPEHRGFVQSRIVKEFARPDVAQIQLPMQLDGIAQSWLDSLEDRRRINQLPQLKAWWADGASHIDFVKAFLLREHVVISPRRGPAPVVKTVSLFRRKDGVGKDAFKKWWLEVHAPTAHTVPGLRGYVLSEILDQPTRADIQTIPLEIDGIAETWADSLEAREKIVATPECQRWYADGAGMMGAIKMFATEEIVFIDPLL